MALFNQISHAVIFFNSVEGAHKTGISAMAKLCFGSDDNAIAQILYRVTPGSKTPLWTLPLRVDGSNSFPIFVGTVGEEILAAVGRAADRLKKTPDLGKLAGRAFRVTKTTVEEVKQQTTTTP